MCLRVGPREGVHYKSSPHLFLSLLLHKWASSEVSLPLIRAEREEEVEDDTVEKENHSKESKDPPPPFIVGDGLPVVPQKLVTKIQSRDFVDMAELPKD